MKLRFWIGLVSLGLLAASTATHAAVAGRAPNIVFIMADDLGWGDLGCYGQKRIQTPRLDQMAAEGIRFTQVYAGSTVCAPSRCVLMTGLNTGHCRVRGNARHPLLPKDLTVAKVLHGSGYDTALIGKWGLGEPGTTGVPNRQGFDNFFGYLDQHHAHNYYPSYFWHNQERVSLPNVVPNEDKHGGGYASTRIVYSHDLFIAKAVDFLKQHLHKRFFLYLALTIPHANDEAGKKGMEVPDLGPYANRDWPAPQKAQAAMVTRMDHDVGKLLDLLKTLGLDRQTIVFFTSDNGPHREGGNDPNFNDSNGPLRGIKRDLYEGGIRVPMIVRWPGHTPAGQVSDVPWYFADFLPTAAELAGTSVSGHLDGVSVVPALLGKPMDLSHRYLYWEFHERGFQQAARYGDWKAIRAGLKGPIELYNLAEDIGEKHNVAAKHPDVVAQFKAYFQSARTDSPYWPVR